MSRSTPRQLDEMPDALTVPEAAEVLRVSASTVHFRLLNGQMPGAKFGRAWRVGRESLRRYINGEWDPEAKRFKPTSQVGEGDQAGTPPPRAEP